MSGTWSIIVCFSTFSFLDYICLFGCSMCQQMFICIFLDFCIMFLGVAEVILGPFIVICHLNCIFPFLVRYLFPYCMEWSICWRISSLFFLTRRFKTNVESLSLTSFPLYPMLSIASNVFDSSLLSIQQSIVKVGFPNCPQVPCS